MVHYLFADLAVLRIAYTSYKKFTIYHWKIVFFWVCIEKTARSLWAYKEETKKLANCTYHCIIGAVRRTAPINILITFAIIRSSEHIDVTAVQMYNRRLDCKSTTTTKSVKRNKWKESLAISNCTFAWRRFSFLGVSCRVRILIIVVVHISHHTVRF